MNKIRILIVLLFLSVFLRLSTYAYASFFSDILKSVKNLTQSSSQTVSLVSAISLAPDGDVNNNREIDAGDTITFSYTINNPTSEEISFATLITNIPRNYLHFIHNIQGASSLSDKNETITIPNLRINPGQTLEVKFDAGINYFNDGDKSIYTQAEIVTKDKKTLYKAERKEIKAKLWKGKFPSNIGVRLKK